MRQTSARNWESKYQTNQNGVGKTDSKGNVYIFLFIYLFIYYLFIYSFAYLFID